MTRRGRLFSCRRGVTALEFGMIAPAFFLLLLGTMDVGRFYFTQQSLREVAAAAARQAMVDTTVTGCTVPATRVAATTPFLTPASLSLCVTRATSSGTTTLTVTASYPFTGLISAVRATNNQVTESTTISYSDG